LALTDQVELSKDERTIALLVRENWQAETVAEYFLTHGSLAIETVAGQGLYQSPPALDLLLLLKALERPDAAAYYELAHSAFFKCYPSKERILKLRNSQGGTRKICEYLTSLFDRILSGTAQGRGYASWECVLRATRTTPLLQILQILYDQLRPWNKCAGDDWTQRFYEINVYFLLEEVVNKMGLDALTTVKLVRFLERNLWGNQNVECRYPEQGHDDIRILCATVHKAKGLEYGHVILPYTDWSLERYMKKGIKVIVNSDKSIGYSIHISSGQEKVTMTNSGFCEVEETLEIRREEARILYVAMTRAMAGLSWLTAAEPRKDSWSVFLRGLNQDVV
jgi:ATP-dependent exoDNAse (exonuclease V) beta subunit